MFAIQVSPVTGVTKNTNAIPIFCLFVTSIRMKTADALMVVYYVVLSGVLVFTLGYLAGWRHAKGRQ